MKRYLHKKRGTKYEIVATGRLQCGKPLHDMEKVIIYKGEDGQYWVRSEEQFFDGRFVEIEE